MNEPWHIQLFGVLRARQGERLIARFRTQQTGALLAYLAYHRHSSHTREALIELFWPESEPETGRHNLSNALSSLRNQLEPPGVSGGAVIIADRFSVELNPDAVTTDVAEFEQALRCAAQARTTPNYAQRLAEAAEQYRGSLLPHYYEDWIAPEQERLQQRFLQTVSQLIGLLEKTGELERALDFAQRSLSADPLREESHRDVMRLLAAAGQPEAALRRFRELESIFSQELGETPSAAARQLARQIEVQVTSAPAASLPTPVPLPPPGSSEASMPALPTGTVTFLLTDIEGSTALWEKTGEAFRSVLTTHHALLRAEFRRNGGQEVKEAGDSFLVAFAGASDALYCAIACQKALEAQPWPEALGSLRVRMALHTGDVDLEEGEYHGLMLHRAARMLSAGHGGQILVSEATSGLLRRDLEPGVQLKDLGVWRLRDLEEPERLFQVETPKLETREFPPLNASPAHSARLPLQFTRFYGRTEEIATIAERLQSTAMRLLTLTGPGGTGKTRLAIEAVSKVAETYSGGIWFIPLADLSDPDFIADAIVSALGVPRVTSLEPMEQAVTALAKQPSLLILDNFEQIVDGGAEIIRKLLQRLPMLQCVVTSRQLLGLEGEYEFVVAPLPTPNGSDTPERLSMFESVRLFVDRAQAAKPDFRITGSNAAAVAELCDRLEGLPLAIELAAARALVLTPRQMLAQLGSRFEFLVSRKRGVAERQRTLRAAVDWSYKLLAPELQRFFAQLSVFRGGWNVAAAEAVCEEPLALDYLAQLRECSLVLTEERAGVIRFRMLETLREYGGEQLSAEEIPLLQNRHLDYFLQQAEATSGFCWETDANNLRAALEWSREGRRLPTGLRIANACTQCWWWRGYGIEGLEHLRILISQVPTTESHGLRAIALSQAGLLTLWQGEYTAARAFLEESLAVHRQLEYPNLRANLTVVISRLALVVQNTGEYEAARSFYEEVLKIEQELQPRGGANVFHNMGCIALDVGDFEEARRLTRESIERGGNPVLNESTLAEIAWKQGDYATARALCEKCIAAYRAMGSLWRVAEVLYTLGGVAQSESDLSTAWACYSESLKHFRDASHKSDIARLFESMAGLAQKQAHSDRAAQLAGAAEALREALGAPKAPYEREEYARVVVAAQEALGEKAFASARAAGRAMTWEQAVAYALEESREKPASS